MSISEDLRAALQSWLDWAEGGAPNGEPFFRDVGLCTNMWEWDVEVGPELREVLEEEFVDDFEYPFGQHDYIERQDDSTLHQCPKRLAWVRKILGEDA